MSGRFERQVRDDGQVQYVWYVGLVAVAFMTMNWWKWTVLHDTISGDRVWGIYAGPHALLVCTLNTPPTP